MKLHTLLVIIAGVIGAAGYYSQQAYANVFLQGESIHSASIVENATLNINTADAEQLGSLPGIGAKKAEAIVAYRELNGQFNSVDELVNVKGIGPKMLSKLEGKISI